MLFVSYEHGTVKVVTMYLNTTHLNFKRRKNGDKEKYSMFLGGQMSD